jgi:hypothetical protein
VEDELAAALTVIAGRRAIDGTGADQVAGAIRHVGP